MQSSLSSKHDASSVGHHQHNCSRNFGDSVRRISSQNLWDQGVEGLVVVILLLRGREDDGVAHVTSRVGNVVAIVVETIVDGAVARWANQSPVSLYFHLLATADLTILLVDLTTVATDVVEFL